MGVIAKFVVAEINKRLDQSGGHVASSVVLTSVYGEENKTWAKYTPAARITMEIDNPPAFAWFDPVGKTVFVHFSDAPAAEADEK